MRWIWKDYFGDLYNIETQEQVTVYVCGFDGVQRSNYFEGEPIKRNEEEARVMKLKNGKAAGKDEVTEEMIKDGCDIGVDWIWRVCNMVFESGVAPEDWISVVIVPLYKGKWERTECKSYRLEKYMQGY